jgi:hypothetical protein
MNKSGIIMSLDGRVKIKVEYDREYDEHDAVWYDYAGGSWVRNEAKTSFEDSRDDAVATARANLAAYEEARRQERIEADKKLLKADQGNRAAIAAREARAKLDGPSEYIDPIVRACDDLLLAAHGVLNAHADRFPAGDKFVGELREAVVAANEAFKAKSNA